MKKLILFTAMFATLSTGQQPPAAQTSPPAASAGPGALAAAVGGSSDQLLKRIDDVLWFTRMADIADVDKIEFTSLPPARTANPKAPGATNPLIIHGYTFIPKKLDRSKKQPFITFAHQGVHANFDTSDLHIIRELVGQGYSIIACDYRGSTGYGTAFYRDIDYGGREIDDVFNSTQYMLDTSTSWIRREPG